MNNDFDAGERNHREILREAQKRLMEFLREQGVAPCQAFCVRGCPIHQDNKSWLYAFREGEIGRALDRLLVFNPLPASCSRICGKFCEKEADQFCGIGCLEKAEGFQGAIHLVEKYLGDWARLHQYRKPRRAPFQTKKVGVIGAGPSGLACGYQLWHLGYSVAIFEKRDKPGGLLYFGISEERLPKKVLFDEISLHLSGIEFKTQTEIDAQGFIKLREAYDAILIATGLAAPRKLGIPGENLPGVISSIDFLASMNLKTGPDIKKKKVVIIGGGETAIEVASTVLNSGGSAKIIYRKGEENLGFPKEEVQLFKNRGGEIDFYLSPKNIGAGVDGRLEITFEKTSRETSEVSVFLETADFIAPAVGQTSQLEFLPPEIRERVAKKDFEALESTGIFVAGDLAYGQKSVAQAISSGNETAIKIQTFLKSGQYIKKI